MTSEDSINRFTNPNLRLSPPYTRYTCRVARIRDNVFSRVGETSSLLRNGSSIVASVFFSAGTLQNRNLAMNSSMLSRNRRRREQGSRGTSIVRIHYL
jgi:hypothetical protein